MSAEHVWMLESARQDIAAKHEQFICIALPISLESKEICAQIEADLNCGTANTITTLDSWLTRHGYLTIPIESYREIRLAWIDALIEYWRDR